MAVLAWFLVRYSVKLPVARFFFVTTYLLLALAFILMGKAMSALREADIIDITKLPVSFDIDWVGVKSTWQGPWRNCRYWGFSWSFWGWGEGSGKMLLLQNVQEIFWTRVSAARNRSSRQIPQYAALLYCLTV